MAQLTRARAVSIFTLHLHTLLELILNIFPAVRLPSIKASPHVRPVAAAALAVSLGMIIKPHTVDPDLRTVDPDKQTDLWNPALRGIGLPESILRKIYYDNVTNVVIAWESGTWKPA